MSSAFGFYFLQLFLAWHPTKDYHFCRVPFLRLKPVFCCFLRHYSQDTGLTRDLVVIGHVVAVRINDLELFLVDHVLDTAR